MGPKKKTDEDKAAVKIQSKKRQKDAKKKVEDKKEDIKVTEVVNQNTEKEDEMRATFTQFDANGDSNLSLGELAALIKDMNATEGLLDDGAVGVFIKKNFKEADKDGNKQIDWDEFVEWYNHFQDWVAAEKATKAEQETSKGGGGGGGGGDGGGVTVDGKPWADLEPDEQRAAINKSKTDFFAKQKECWEVPLGGKIPQGEGVDPMDYLWMTHTPPPPTTGMQSAIKVAANDKKTPLIIDTSPQKVVDTFYMYQSTTILEAKKMFMDERNNERTHEEVMEDNRKSLINSIKFGHTLYIRLANSAADFKNKYCSDDCFPLAVFDYAVWSELPEKYSDGVGDNLKGSGHPFEACLRDEDLEGGVFKGRRGFEVIVCSHFEVEDYKEFLEDMVPLDKMQAMHMLVD